MNKRITARERGLLKGAIRRVFARSELRQQVIDRTRIEHFDPSRPRVKKWSKCELCIKPTPTYLIEVDHVDPVIPVTSSFEELGLDNTADRTWCDIINLQGICELCHDEKSAVERKQRKENKANGRQDHKTVKKSTKKRSSRNSTRSP